MKGIAIVIVTYNSEEVILGCLDACLPYATEVIVVDNASTDSTVEQVRRRPAVTLIANTANYGFAGGVNQGIEATRQPLVLLLNPDTRLTTGLGALARACLTPDVGASAGRLVGEDGNFQLGFSLRRLPSATTLIYECLGLNRIWRSNSINSAYRYLDYDFVYATDVEQPAGAFLMLRRDVWEQLEGFDERFHPVWFEDVDYCKRLKDKGFRIRLEPSATATHLGGHSAAQLDPGHRTLYWYGSLLEYAGKHFTRHAVRAVSLAVILGAGVRSVMGTLRHRSLRPIATYAKVIRLACRSFLSLPLGGADSANSSCRRPINQAQIHVL